MLHHLKFAAASLQPTPQSPASVWMSHFAAKLASKSLHGSTCYVFDLGYNKQILVLTVQASMVSRA